MELKGKIAVVTGAGRGIGRAIALELGAAGAEVIVNYRHSADAAAAVADAVGGRAVQADVSTTSGCEVLMDAAGGRVDILVNNAGVTHDGLAMRMKDEAWDHVLATNAGGTFRMTRAVLPGMCKARWGSVVNIVSVTAIRGNAGQANYAASKAAILAFTRSVAKEVARRGVRVNALAPGFVQTDMTNTMSDRIIEAATEAIPMRRLGQPEEIAPMVRFLCGPGAGYITGQLMVIDGGLSA